MDEAGAPTDRSEGGADAVRGALRPGSKAASANDPSVLAGVNELARQVGAIDDAWITCVVLLEKLQSPTLAPDQAATLLADLTTRYKRFRQALRPIERLIGGDFAKR